MAENSGISWTDSTFNPWMGCLRVSPGCQHCYAEKLVTERMGKPMLWGPAQNSSRQVTSRAYWKQPGRWNQEAQAAGERRRVFVASLADVFEDHPGVVGARARFWELVASTPHLDWLLLTKRPENIARMLPESWGDGPPNVWLGTSIESQEQAHRATTLRRVPAVVRFVSYEPALGPLVLDLDGLHWVIYGGESGSQRRPDNPQWARDMRDACSASGVTFFYKQSSALRAGQNPYLDGVQHYAWPRTRCRSSGELSDGRFWL